MTLTEVVRLHCAKAGVRFRHPETEGFCFISDNGYFRRDDGLFVYVVVLDLTDLMRNDWEVIS